MLGFLTEPLCWVLGIAYMPYMSFKAIQTPDGKDDIEWLTNWVIYSIVTMFQTTPLVGQLITWFPFWYETKFVFIIYCIFFGGSKKIYQKVIYPIFKKYEKSTDDLIGDLPNKAREVYVRIGHDDFVKTTLTQGNEFMMEHGADAYRTALALAHLHAKDGISSANPTSDTEMDSLQAGNRL